MSNTTSFQLTEPTVQADGNDLVVISDDGQREWQIRSYLSNLEDEARQSKLDGLNFPVTLDRQPSSPDQVWAMGSAADDVIVGNDIGLNIVAGHGDDVVLAGAGVDYIDGDDGNDWLYGGSGDDDLMGGSGNDRLYGEDGNDRLQGEAGNDRLYGGRGNDQLYGGQGNDRLTGGPGNDLYVFQRGDGQDKIFNACKEGEIDAVQFAGDISVEQLWFRKIGEDLQVSVMGTDDSVTIGKWYAANARRVDRFDLIPDTGYHARGDRYLDMADVEPLVQAMSAFTPPPAGTISLSDDYRTALAPVLAAQWK